MVIAEMLVACCIIELYHERRNLPKKLYYKE